MLTLYLLFTLVYSASYVILRMIKTNFKTRPILAVDTREKRWMNGKTSRIEMCDIFTDCDSE
jgi:hypothetical protein